MTVRVGKFVDIPQIVELAKLAHKESVYGEISTFNSEVAKQVCARSIQRQGHMNFGGSMFLVSETDDEIRGFIIGILDSVYPCVEELMATDLIFSLTNDADKKDAVLMIRQLVNWARKNPKVVEVHLGVTDAILGGDWKRVGKLYEKLGFQRCGGMFRMLMPRQD